MRTLCANHLESCHIPHTLQVKPGVLYTTSSKKVADHGGLNEDDAHVALLVSGGALKSRQAPCRGKNVQEPVFTRQVAPTVLQLLGLDPSSLDAVRAQGTKVLPGLLSSDGC
jgi:hypothetical protein